MCYNIKISQGGLNKIPWTGYLGFGKDDAMFGVPSDLLEQLAPSVFVAIALMIVLHFSSGKLIYVFAPALAVALTAATWTAVVWYHPELPLILDRICVLLMAAGLTAIIIMLKTTHEEFKQKNREAALKKVTRPMAASGR